MLRFGAPGRGAGAGYQQIFSPRAYNNRQNAAPAPNSLINWNTGANGGVNAAYNAVVPGNDSARQFARRMGIARMFERNENLLQTLAHPENALREVQTELLGISNEGEVKYAGYLAEFRNLGFGEEEAVARADIMVGRELESRLSLLQIKYPYATGGAEAGGWDPVAAILNQNAGGDKIRRTFKAIGSSQGLGVGQGKKAKRIMKRKYKKKYGKK